MPEMPVLKVPKNLKKALEDGEGYWEDDRWSPILLTVMSDTELNGREIPIAWQTEFDPSDDEFEDVNQTLEEMGIETDGYGWGEYIRKKLGKTNPSLGKRLHLDDCETDTCVIWVEAEDDCRMLLETTWRLIFKK